MINVYWSPWYRQSNLYVDNYLNYPELDSAYLDLVKGKDNSNHAIAAMLSKQSLTENHSP